MTKADGSGLHGGPLPESIGRLDQVYIIWAYGNNLSGEIPQSMNNLRKLQNLNLSNNSLTGSIPDIFSDKPLTYLDLTLNRFTGPVPPLPYMASSCYITSYSSTEGNKFTCLAGDPLNHRGACYDNLRALQLQPCTPHRPPVATDVPPDPQEQAPPQPTSAGPPGLPPVMIVLISMSATAAFVSIVALSVFTAQQRRRKRRLEATDLAAGAGPSGAKDVVYAKLAVGAEQGHLYTAVQGQSAVLSRGGEAGGLVFVVPKQGHRGRGQQVMLMPAAPRQVREEEELFLPQEEVEIPEVDIGE
ncbi:hypothetical protein BCR44DRAFT_37614 [Catenaria anguillulae PL171]|uniref:Uncharacterized protein n=1 Tax=Catenaria anguillulae PL171 TaxID=765915 RepID=A0A1Y2HVB0_9FUNG|nr:hypothetical protein BCR44DRAFT_37614 [Catenaria anguillulae PL171]